MSTSAHELAGTRPRAEIQVGQRPDQLDGARRHAPRLVLCCCCSRPSIALLFLYTVTLVFTVGIGKLGVDIPVAWGFPIVNVVWWIGIGHAGTLISAVLLLLRQKWRTSINRFAEAMTLFAASIAGFFPIIHLGRPWFFYWLVPYPGDDARLAAVAQPARLGLLRDRDLHHRVAAVLVRGPDPRSRHAARPREVAHARRIYGAARARLARLGACIGRGIAARICCSPRSRRRSWSRCTA